MADLETTQSKLRSTPTAGVSGEHSAYYRRLLSAGYKGYIQGSIGGGTLYGVLGLALGAVIGIPLAPFTGGMSLWMIPAIGGVSGIYGAHTFADIGKTAAIIADSADTNERRRYLLDRYYETPSDEEAKEIRRQLEEDHAPKTPEKAFHWRPALVGIGLGMLLAAGVAVMMLHGVPLEFLHAPIEMLAHAFDIVLPAAGGTAHMLEGGAVTTGALAGLVGVGAAIGGLAGSVIGLDREYVRRWLDKSEFVVNEPNHATQAIAARERDIQRLAEAAKRDTPPLADAAPKVAEKPAEIIAPQSIASVGTHPLVPSLERRADPISPQTIAGVEHPSNKVHAAQHMDRMVALDQLARQGI